MTLIGSRRVALLGPQRFNPLSLGAALAFWVDPRRLSGFADTDLVATQPDLSGNGRDATASLAERGTYSLAGINGRPAILYDGTANRYAADTVAAVLTGTDVPFTYCGVWDIDRTGQAAEQIYDLVAAAQVGSSTPREHILEQYFNGGVYKGRSFRRDDAAGTVSVLGTTDFPDPPSVYTVVHTGIAVTVYVNGTQYVTGAQNVEATTLDTFTLGALRTASTTLFTKGLQGEQLMVGSALSTAVRRKLERYLGAGWGIVVA